MWKFKPTVWFGWACDWHRRQVQWWGWICPSSLVHFHQSIIAVTVFSSCLCAVHGVLHMYVLFFFSLSPLLLLLLSVLDDKAIPGASEDDGKLSVGPVLIDPLAVCFRVCLLFLCSCSNMLLPPYCKQEIVCYLQPFSLPTERTCFLLHVCTRHARQLRKVHAIENPKGLWMLVFFCRSV